MRLDLPDLNLSRPILAIVAPLLLAGGSRVEWPGVSDSAGQHPPIVLELSDDKGILSLSVTNNLSPTYSTPSTATLDLGSRVVGIVFEQARGDEPDLVTIAPPVGFIAVPNDFLIEEGETVLVRIVRGGLS
jgi:hypothetical protein